MFYSLFHPILSVWYGHCIIFLWNKLLPILSLNVCIDDSTIYNVLEILLKQTTSRIEKKYPLRVLHHLVLTYALVCFLSLLCRFLCDACVSHSVSLVCFSTLPYKLVKSILFQIHSESLCVKTRSPSPNNRQRHLSIYFVRLVLSFVSSEGGLFQWWLCKKVIILHWSICNSHSQQPIHSHEQA